MVLSEKHSIKGCQGTAEALSPPDSDAQRPVFPLRVRNKGDEA